MRRYLIVAGALGLLLLAGAGAALLLNPFQARLNVEGFKHIRNGLTWAEVEELLGGPPGNYGRYAGGMSKMTMEGYLAPPGSIEQIWCDDTNRFEIYFDANDRVVGFHRRAGFLQEPPPARNWLDQLRIWLGW
jgi:hypothetical protein